MMMYLALEPYIDVDDDRDDEKELNEMRFHGVSKNY